MSAQSGFTISCDDLTQQWYGWKWSRVNCFNTEMTCLTGPATSSEARAWLAKVARKRSSSSSPTSPVGRLRQALNSARAWLAEVAG
jgi:hypothetical protein